MKRNGLAFAGVVAAALLTASPVVAQNRAATDILVLDADGTALPKKEQIRVGSMDIVAGSYATAGAAVIGYSGVDGSQYMIDNPELAEVIQVTKGEISFVDKDGKEYPSRAGQVSLLPPGRPNTARDGKGYVHQYIVFPANGAAVKDLPNNMVLDPSSVEAAKFTASADGQTYDFLKTDEGNRVVAWKASARGSVKDAKDSRYVAFTAGTGSIRQGKRSIPLAANTTIYIPAGATYDWRGDDLQAVYVSVPAGR